MGTEPFPRRVTAQHPGTRFTEMRNNPLRSIGHHIPSLLSPVLSRCSLAQQVGRALTEPPRMGRVHLASYCPQVLPLASHLEMRVDCVPGLSFLTNLVNALCLPRAPGLPASPHPPGAEKSVGNPRLHRWPQPRAEPGASTAEKIPTGESVTQQAQGSLACVFSDRLEHQKLKGRELWYLTKEEPGAWP